MAACSLVPACGTHRHPDPGGPDLPPAALFHYVYFDRGGIPDIGPFIAFTPPTTGEVLDARGEVLTHLAREYRQIVTYDEIPVVVRQAILAAED